MNLRSLPAALAALALLALAPAAHAAQPPIGHVFVIVLENENADSAFGPSSQAPYLAQTLTAQGAFVPGYYGTGHASLDDYVAMVSGQAPTTVTQADCPLFVDVFPGVPTSDGQVLGQGCVYPAAVQTIADQLAAKGLTWGGYMEDMGNDPARDNGSACAHPAIGHPDQTQQASATTSTPRATTRSSTSTRSSTTRPTAPPTSCRSAVSPVTWRPPPRHRA